MTSAPPSPFPTHPVLGERARGAWLAAQHFHRVLLDTAHTGTRYPLGSEIPRMGKAPDNDVVLDSPTVSSNHLVVRRQAARFLVGELGSTLLLGRAQGNIARAAPEAELDREHLDSLPHKYGLVQSDEG